jgi:hypothetical protein
VTSHLVQAQAHLVDLRRTLTHATEMLAYNTAQRSPWGTAARGPRACAPPCGRPHVLRTTVWITVGCRIPPNP